MAMDRMLLGCVYLACYTFSLIVAQDSPAESVFRVLSAEQLQELNWRQNPELLEIAAKTGENVTIFIHSSSQGGVVQESVNTVLNCTPWLMNFPGGTVRWYKYRLSSLNHYLESDRTFQNPETIDSMRFSIEGQQDEILRIIRGVILEDAEDSSRGIYECEVCTAGGMIGSEDCHSANTTILNVGRPPIINRGIGREPVTPDDIIETYNIGSTICIDIDPVHPERNRPMQVVHLQCADVGDDDELNIPSALPKAVVSWEHTLVDGTRTAFFAENVEFRDIEMVGYKPPIEFWMEFPLIAMTDVFSVSTNSPPAISALDFITENITRNPSIVTYQALMQAFGTWTCTLNNSLGSETATTFISDLCGRYFPSIVTDCQGIGTLVLGTNNTYMIDPRLSDHVSAGCDINVPADSSLTFCPIQLICHTTFGAIIASLRWTKGDTEVSTAASISVTERGNYTCSVVFDNGDMDSATSIISCESETVLVTPVSATSVNVSWSGSTHLTTSLTYTVSSMTSGSLMSQNTIHLLPGVNSTVVSVKDDLTLGVQYQHKFSLFYVDIFDPEFCTTTSTFSFDKAFFQIRFGPIDYCVSWGKTKTADIDRQLREYLTLIILNNCSDCETMTHHFLRTGLFLCRNNPTITTYRSTIVNPFPTTNSSRLVDIIQSWVSTAPSLVLDGLLMRVVPSCPTVLTSLDETECVSSGGRDHDPGLSQRITQILNVCALRELGDQICSI